MKRLKLLLAGIGFVITLSLPSLVAADVNDFVVTSFSADETLSRNDPQGELHIKELIKVDFHAYNHGILRAIPKSYKRHSLQLKVNRVSSDSGAPTQYTTYSSNGNTVLKIGDPNRTITGSQAYTIDYTLRNVISFYNDHDELYWDVNGDQWGQPFEQVNLTLHLPPGLHQNRQPQCFAGGFGSTANNCSITDQDNKIIASTTQSLTARQTLTYVAGFDKDYFRPAKWYETIGEYSKTITAILAPIALITGGAAWVWWRKGRDVKGTGVIVPQYAPPDGMKPLEIDTLMDFKTDNRALTATIIDLAIRGYFKIIESKKDRLIGADKLSYALVLMNPDFSGLGNYEAVLMAALFPVPKAGEIRELSTSKSSLYSVAGTLKTKVKHGLADAGYFRQSPLSAGAVLRAIAIFIIVFILAVAGYVSLGPPVLIGLAIAFVLAMPFLLSMDARTAKGVAAKEQIEGLKLYMNVAEKDRIAKLQAPNAEYAANAREPVKTVDLFEKLLPYAMVLGVEKGWAKQFESLYTTPPDWYSGNWSTFNAYYLASSLNDGIGSAVNTSFSSPSSSSGSGFGGGGSSGGGGGGGGGGGW